MCGKNETIRKAELLDADAIFELLVQLEEHNLDRKRYLEVFEYNMSDPDVFYLVYESEGTVKGFVSIHIQNLLHHVSKIAEIQELVVEKESRSQGIGTKLFESARQTARDMNCTQIEVCCNMKREKSICFYEKHGLEKSHYKFVQML